MSMNLPHSGEHELDEVIGTPLRQMSQGLRAGVQTVQAIRTMRERANATATQQDTNEREEGTRAGGNMARQEREEVEAALSGARTTWQLMERQEVWDAADHRTRADATVLAAAWSQESPEARQALETFRDRIEQEYGPEAVEDVDNLEKYARAENTADAADQARENEGQLEEVAVQAALVHDDIVSEIGEDNTAAEDADMLTSRASEAAGAEHMRADELDADATQVIETDATQVIDTRDTTNRPEMDEDTREAVEGVRDTYAVSREESLGAARKRSAASIQGTGTDYERTRSSGREL